MINPEELAICQCRDHDAGLLEEPARQMLRDRGPRR